MKQMLILFPIPIPGGLKRIDLPSSTIAFWSSMIADMLPCVTPISVFVLYVEIDICYCYVLANVKKWKNHYYK